MAKISDPAKHAAEPSKTATDASAPRTFLCSTFGSAGDVFPMLDRALREGIEAVPGAAPALRRLMAHVEEVPAWVDWDRIRRGGETFLRTGRLGGLVLGAGSLMAGYAQPAGNKPLALSGRLEQQAARRLAETSRFVWQVTRASGLRRDGDGFAITVKVRLMHARVRALLDAPEARPKRFVRGHDVIDTKDVGFVSDARAEGKGLAVDVNVPGNSNEGHLFGTTLAPHEKDALVEYMKTL